MYVRIKQLREDRDLTQAQMASVLGVSQATYSRYESGRLDIPTDVLIKIARFHQVSADYILELQN